ncbi:MAG: aminoacetone oxidase family FAD-binding enzyme [Clostridia bacterium]|nr:aminoacetone oxidase family FAD-binding enzyme [Clostridia bacterium]
MYDIAVIGAGASGLCAAISAKRESPSSSVVIIEALPRVGKKILATGNGRCNLTNTGLSCEKFNRPDFTREVFGEYNCERITAFFESVGLMTFVDPEGRVYPLSNTANSVLDALRFECVNLGVKILTELHADNVSKTGDGFEINGKIRCKRLIISTAGKACRAHGSDGSGYKLARMLGHSIVEPCPGLVALTVKDPPKALKGIRVRAKSALISDGRSAATSQGEVLFTDYGLSGICIMDLSLKAVKLQSCTVALDVLPDLCVSSIVSVLESDKSRNPSLSLCDAMGGFMHRTIAAFILKRCGIGNDRRLGECGEADFINTASAAKSLSFEVTGTRGFDNAQITVGGVDTSEINERDLSSKKTRGLYFSGEIMDVDAVCGGYNLSWAWASGLTAGRAAAEF